jgi:hypothetical protein
VQAAKAPPSTRQENVPLGELLLKTNVATLVTDGCDAPELMRVLGGVGFGAATRHTHSAGEGSVPLASIA